LNRSDMTEEEHKEHVKECDGCEIQQERCGYYDSCYKRADKLYVFTGC
jgi:hypothetical protein